MPKTKKIPYEMIEQNHYAYKTLEAMRKHHPEIQPARIGLAWHKALKPDADGHLVLGKCVKLSDLHREFFDLDFIIVLNRETWNEPEFTKAKKEALIDHELCHAAASTDAEGEPRKDERGRGVWRVKKHDIEEFHEIIQRHGCYKRDLELFAELLRKKRNTPLFPETSEAQGTIVRQ